MSPSQPSPSQLSPHVTRLRHRSRVRAAVAASVALVASVACDARADNASVAEALFRDGRAAMREGDYVGACPRLAESQRLDPSAGTLLNLALCEEKLGHVATAWAHFRGVADQVSERDERAPIAREHIAALTPRLPFLRLRVVGRPVEVVTILLDGTELRAVSLSAALPIDPGDHVVVGRAAGSPDQRVAFTLREAETHDETVYFPAETQAAPTPERPPPATSASIPATVPAPSSVQRNAGYALLGLGAAGVVTSVVFAALARGRQSEVDAHCHGGACDSTGLAAASTGTTYERWATVGFIVGVVGLGSGAWLTLTAPSAPSGNRTAFPLRLQLGGRF